MTGLNVSHEVRKVYILQYARARSVGLVGAYTEGIRQAVCLVRILPFVFLLRAEAGRWRKDVSNPPAFLRR